MTLREIYNFGIYTGDSIAKCNPNSSIEECVEIECEHYRQFSPFEFYAKHFNDRKNPEKAWEEYERGVLKGITQRKANNNK